MYVIFGTHCTNDVQVKHRGDLLDYISSSPLLTEDDFNLLQFIISHHHVDNQHSQAKLPHTQQQLKLTRNSYQYLNQRTLSLATLLTSIIFAIASMILLIFPLSVTILIVFLAVAVVAIVGLVVARWRVKLGANQRHARAVASVKTYIEDFETLLSLLTQTTRLVRETEIISHGFSR